MKFFHSILFFLLLLQGTTFSAELKLSPFYVIGPFKDGIFGSVQEAFEKTYPPEAYYLQHNKSDVTGEQYNVEQLPGMVADETTRKWIAKPGYQDGYRNLLPRGPAPSRSEVTYLYRELTSPEAGEVPMKLYAEDYLRVYLNGEEIAAANRRGGPSRFPTAIATNLKLKKGVNTLLLKIASIHGAHGFAFSLPELHPDNPILPGRWSPELLKAGTELKGTDAYLKNFRLDYTPIPMYDPAEAVMYEQLEKVARETPAGKAFKVAREKLRGNATPEKIEAFWRAQVKELPPILFLERKVENINAIAPYWHSGLLGASIKCFDPKNTAEPIRTIFHDPKMGILDFSLSWDAKTIFFSAHTGDSQWQIYEIGVNGKNLKQITQNDINASDNISPEELPNGEIVYVSTQANTWVQCQGKKAGMLYVMNRDGSNPRKISANIDSDHSPHVMEDGRILFSRWDYGIEKNVFARHALWTVNPDGTGMQLFFGNTIEDPAGFWKARQIPGRPEVVCSFGPHHTNQAGMLGVVWNRLGPEAPRGSGYRFITDEIPAYCDTTLAVGYTDAFPLSERHFLVSYGGDGGWKNQLYLIDELGNKFPLFANTSKLGCFSPIPLQARKKPPIVVPQSDPVAWKYREPAEMNLVKPDDYWGTLLVQDVYEGVQPQIQRGEVASIQVIEQVQKSRCMAGGEAWGHTPIISKGTVHVRRVIGRVPVEKDGSAYFRVPALRSISLNLLDAEGKTLMRMGSDMHVMNGEQRSCVGCHEIRTGNLAPLPTQKATLAMKKPPVTPTQEDWGTNGLFSYPKVVQPVWDKHCVSCHSCESKEGIPAAGLDLTGGRTRFFSVSYDNLVERGWVAVENVFALDHDETAPKAVGAIISKLLPYLKKKHTKTELTPDEKYRIFSWIDANVPYYGTYTYTKMRGIGTRDSWNKEGDVWWLDQKIAEPFDRRCMECHKQEAFNPAPYGNPKFTVSSKKWSTRILTSHGFPNRYPRSGLYGPEYRVNLTEPEKSLMLLAPLAKKEGGLGYCKKADGTPVFADKNDADYQKMLSGIRFGQYNLYREPRVDITPADLAKVKKSLLSEKEYAAMLGEMRGKSYDWGGKLGSRKKVEVKGPEKVSGDLKLLRKRPAGLQNYASQAKASSEDGVAIQGKPPEVSPQAAIDGDAATFWDDADGAKEYRLAATFTEPRELQAMTIEGWKHHDFAPASFTVWIDGKQVGCVTNAKYVKNRLGLTFPARKCKSIELRITDAYGGSPAIREWGLLGK